MRTSEEELDVAARDVGEVLAALDGVERPTVPDGPQERHGQRARPDTRLDDPRAGKDVCHRDDLTGVLRVHDRRAARHRERVVAEQRSQREVVDPRGRRDDGPFARPDDVVVLEVAAVRVEGRTRGERDRVEPPARIGELDPVARAERAAPHGGARGVDRFARGPVLDLPGRQVRCRYGVERGGWRGVHIVSHNGSV